MKVTPKIEHIVELGPVTIGPYTTQVLCQHIAASRKICGQFCFKRGCISLTLPKGFAHSKAMLFVTEHSKYFESKLKIWNTVFHSSSVQIIGITYKVSRHPSFRNTSHIDGNDIHLYYVDPSDIVLLIKQIAFDLLCQYANLKVPHYAQQIGQQYNQIRVKDIVTRWGSCSSNKNLNFALKLAFVPLTCIDYVIAHEVCHLAHMNHAAQFWLLVQQLRPAYLEDRKKLKQFFS